MSLTYRIIDGHVDLDVTADLVGEPELGWAAPGGCERAAIGLDLPRDTFPTLGSQSRLIVSSPSGDVEWEGYVSDPGDFDDDDGEGMRIEAVGSMVRGSDVVAPLVYLDAELSAWEPAPDLPVSARADQGDGELVAGFQSGFAIGPGSYTAFDYTRLLRASQNVGAVVLTYSCGVASGYAVDVVAIDSNAGQTQVASWAAGTETVTRTQALPAGTKTARIRLRRTGPATNVVGELAVLKVTKVAVIGSRVDRYGNPATGDATTIGSRVVVEDLIGRGVLAGVDPDAAQVEDSPAVFTQLAFPEGVRGTGVLEKLRESDSSMVWAYGGTTPTGRGLAFSWRPWGTDARYDVDLDDALERPGGQDESCQRVTVYYTDLNGVPRNVTVITEVPAGARIRDADPVTIEEPATLEAATTRGREVLAEVSARTPSGTAVLSRAVLDQQTSTDVEPWELRPGHLARLAATGELARITGVTYTGGDADVATLAIGESGSSPLETAISRAVEDRLPGQPLIPLPPARPAPVPPIALPTTDPTEAPESSPLPVVQPGNGSALVTWDRVTDPHTQIDLHVAYSDTLAPSAATRIAENVVPIQAVQKMPDGTPVPADYSVYFALVARNVAGEAAASPWVAGRAGVIPPELLQLAVGNLTADDVLTKSLRTNGIAIGNGTWNTEMIDVPGVLTIPFNGDPASITVQLNALSAVITNLRILAQTNVIEGGLKLADGVAPPTTAPRVKAVRGRGGPNTEADQGFTLRGFFDPLNGVGPDWYYTESLYNAPSGVWTIRKTDGARFLVANPPGKFFAVGGVVKLGATWYVLGQDFDRQDNWYLYRFNEAWVKTGESLFATASTVLGDAHLSTDGDALFVAFLHRTTGVLRVNQLTATGGLTRYDVLDTAWPDTDVWGLYVGAADLGAARFVVVGRQVARVYTKAGGASGATQARVNPNEWTIVTGACVGIAWDGTRFKTLGANGFVYWYCPRPVVETRTHAYSWYDSDLDGTGRHETQPGAATIHTARARDWVEVEFEAPNDGAGLDDPDSLRHYIDDHRQADLAPGIVFKRYESFDLTGPAGQTINGFETIGGATGSFSSARGHPDGSGPVINLEGNGTWRLGHLAGRADGTDANDTGWVDVRGTLTLGTTDGWPLTSVVYANFRRTPHQWALEYRASPDEAKSFAASNFADQTIVTLPPVARPTRETPVVGRWNDAPIAGNVLTDGRVIIRGGVPGDYAAGTILILSAVNVD